MCGKHESGKVDVAFVLGQELENCTGVFPGVDDTKDLGSGGDFGRYGLIVAAIPVGDLDAVEISEKGFGIRDDFGGCFETDG